MAPSVLIVEDEILLARNIQLYLEHHRYKVHVAGTQEDGLKQFQQVRPNVVLLDIRMAMVGRFFVASARLTQRLESSS